LRISQLPLKYRVYLRSYRWRRVEPVPCARLAKPIEECRVALVSSAGLVAPGDRPFDVEMKGGDPSWRIIPRGVEVDRLEEGHRSAAFDRSGLAVDRNLALPLDRLEEMAAAGEIGDVAPRHVSLMGSVTAPSRLIRHSLPRIVTELLEDGVDVALLAPV
jgi:D-proline reductase (dithiol) PrdB